MAEWLQDLSVGQWYRTDGEPFEIVGIDAKAEIVLVQHYDGTLEELDFDAWLDSAARPCAAPEDYSGALDIERDDYGLDRDEAPGGGRWDNPLDLLDLQDR
ncbi:MAG TPA: DUF6763 family protein [Solimonas sp.]